MWVGGTNAFWEAISQSHFRISARLRLGDKVVLQRFWTQKKKIAILRVGMNGIFEASGIGRRDKVEDLHFVDR